jgi:hypothetical protein
LGCPPSGEEKFFNWTELSDYLSIVVTTREKPRERSSWRPRRTPSGLLPHYFLTDVASLAFHYHSKTSQWLSSFTRAIWVLLAFEVQPNGKPRTTEHTAYAPHRTVQLALLNFAHSSETNLTTSQPYRRQSEHDKSPRNGCLMEKGVLRSSSKKTFRVAVFGLYSHAFSYFVAITPAPTPQCLCRTLAPLVLLEPLGRT